MSVDLRQSYAEREILEANGSRLVVLLYQKAIASLDEARKHLSNGNIAERSRKITNVSEILNELALAVDHDAGGELSHNLVELYSYIQSLVQKANADQIEPPLMEARDLLVTLVEAWEAADRSASATSAAPCYDAPTQYAPVNYVG